MCIRDRGHVVLAQATANGGGVEALMEDDGRTVEAGAKQNRQATDMIEGQAGQPAVAGHNAEAEGGADGAPKVVGEGDDGP